MTGQSNGESRAALRRYRNLLTAASGLTFLLVILGGTVCMTDSTLGCPDWPGCFGQIVPPLQVNAIIEYAHRFVAALTGITILAAAFIGLKRFKAVAWIKRAWIITVFLLLAVVVFGAFAVLTGLPRGVAALDVGSALSVLALVISITVVTFSGRGDSQLDFDNPFSRLGLSTMAASFLVLVSSVLVAPAGSIIRCLGWPMLTFGPFTPSPNAWAQLVRGVFAGITIFLALVTIAQAWRNLQDHREIVWAAFVMGGFLAIEIILGLLIAAGDSSYALLISYVAAAAGQWAAVVVMVVLSGQLSTASYRQAAISQQLS